MPVNPSDIQAQFPFFQHNPELVYLDNAATTQKPQVVIDSIVQYYEQYNSNIGRSTYSLAQTATRLYEEARQTVQQFMQAQSP
jgi:selenocysteine lyase/cysteine desulfurase